MQRFFIFELRASLKLSTTDPSINYESAVIRRHGVAVSERLLLYAATGSINEYGH